MGGNGLIILVMILAFGGIIYSGMNQRKQQEALRVKRESLKPGVKVMLSCGLFGQVENITDKEAEISIAPGVITRWDPLAVAAIVQGDLPGELGEPLAKKPLLGSFRKKRESHSAAQSIANEVINLEKDEITMSTEGVKEKS